jgi:hypothetical protein
MKNKITIGLLLAICVCFGYACKKWDVDNPKYPPLKGAVSGKVILYDTSGTRLPSAAGVTVTLDSSRYTAVTNDSGVYVIPHVPRGSYDVSFTKSGYGTYRLFNQEHTGGAQMTQLATVDVGQIYEGPATHDQYIFSLGSPVNPEIWADMYTTYPVQNPSAGISYFSERPDVSPTNYRAFQRFVIPKNNYPPSLQWDTYGPVDKFMIRADSVLANSPKIYWIIVFDNVRYISYVNESGLRIFPCVSSVKASFIASNTWFIKGDDPNAERSKNTRVILKNQ